MIRLGLGLLVLAYWLANPSISAGQLFSGEKLFAPPFYSVPKISPNGNFVVGRINDGERRELVLTDTQSQQRYPLVFFAKRNYLEDFHWIDNDSIYIEYRSGEKFRQSIIDLDVDNLGTKQPARRVTWEGYMLAPLPTAPDQVLFVKQSENQPPVIYHANTANLLEGSIGQSRRFSNPLPKVSRYFYDEAKQTYFGLQIDVEKKQMQLWFLSEEQGTWRKLHDLTNFQYEFKALQYIGEDKFLVLTNRASDRVAVAVYDLASQAVEKIVFEHPQYDVIDAEIDEITGELVSATYLEHGTPKVEYFQERAAQQQDNFAIGEDGDGMYLIDSSLDKSKQLVLAYGPSHPGSYLFFDGESRRPKLIEHAYPELIEHEFSKTRRIALPRGAGGFKQAYLTLPYLKGNGVMLLYLRTEAVKPAEFSRSVQYLANRGYAVLRLDYQSPINFKAGGGELGAIKINSQLEQDINAAAQYVKQQFNYAKTCPIGFGHGGYSALRLAMLYPDNYHCLVSLFGIYDFQLLFSANNAETLNLNQQAMREILTAHGDSLVGQSPVYMANGYDLPTLLVAGNKDEIAIPEQINRLKYVLDKQTDKVEHIIYKDLGHGVRTWFGDHQLHAVIDDFIRRNLQLGALDSQEHPHVVAKEYVRIADLYGFDSLLQNNAYKAFNYYVKAARLGHPRAMFNYGAHYHRGQFVEQNLGQALHWYKKASDAGFAAASYRLGQQLEAGNSFAGNENTALQYFQKARQQGFDARAGLKVAETLCMGAKSMRDPAQCIALLDLKQIKHDNRGNRSKLVTEASTQMLHALLPRLLFAKGNTAEQQNFYKQLLLQDFSIVDSVTGFQLVEEGIFSDEGVLGHTSTTYEIPAVAGTHFGIRFHLEAEIDKGERGAVLAKISRVGADAKEETVYLNVMHKNSGRNWYLKHILKGSELSPATYTFEILSLDQEPLYSRSFNLVAP